MAKQWHPTKNGDVFQDEVEAYAREAYWWLCENGHEWKKALNSKEVLSVNTENNTKFSDTFNNFIK
ncbi:zinc-ribbon domain-containing protein [Peribacillus glennii]|uniref:Treble clef zinc finger domain-containing protein n=1 Tax=Peribacillus glennii TaxID=2303991 RepID=A0A372L9C1_9BACI|nr:hypothetical protein D0466_17845 [Peribacillus glennii]